MSAAILATRAVATHRDEVAADARIRHGPDIDRNDPLDRREREIDLYAPGSTG